MLDHIERALARRPGRPWPDPPADIGRAAVAAVLRPRGDLLFIRRSEREGDPWSGHMAFPGGRLDPRDASPQAAAERESAEEVGLDLVGQGRLLGSLDELISPVRSGPYSLVISPFVYQLAVDEPILLPNHEVADIHWFDLDRLAGGEGRGTFTLPWKGQVLELPRLDLDGVRIWGLTLHMLDDLLGRLGLEPVRR